MVSQNLSNIFTEIKDNITTSIVRFKQADRFLIKDNITNSDLGYEDILYMKPNGVPTNTLQSTGKLETYNIYLVYIAKLEYVRITDAIDFYEELDEILVTNCYGTYYYQLKSTMDYDTPIQEFLPEDYEGDMDGFVLNLEVKAGKF